MSAKYHRRRQCNPLRRRLDDFVETNRFMCSPQKRKRYRLPQYDGGGDNESSEPVEETAEDAWNKVVKSLNRVKRQRLDQGAYVLLERHPALEELLAKKDLRDRKTRVESSSSSSVENTASKRKSTDGFSSNETLGVFEELGMYSTQELVEQARQRTKCSPNESKQEEEAREFSVISGQKRRMSPPPALSLDVHGTKKYEYVYNRPPPVLPNKMPVRYQEPHYSKSADVPSVPRVFSGKEFWIPGNDVKHLKPFNPPGAQPLQQSIDDQRWKRSGIRTWTPATLPPSPKEVQAWLATKRKMTQESANSNTREATQVRCLFFMKSFGHKVDSEYDLAGWSNDDEHIQL